jgi:hypothetical protein
MVSGAASRDLWRRTVAEFSAACPAMAGAERLREGCVFSGISSQAHAFFNMP